MTVQSYASHRRYVPGYHYYTTIALFVLLIWAIYRLVQAASVDRAMVVLLVIGLMATAGWARVFAVGVQDRVIRLEERLRLAALLPEALRPRIAELTPRQLVAIRFASDPEVADLCRRVFDGSLKEPDEIKRAIKTWRPDDMRV